MQYINSQQLYNPVYVAYRTYSRTTESTFSAKTTVNHKIYYGRAISEKSQEKSQKKKTSERGSRLEFSWSSNRVMTDLEEKDNSIMLNNGFSSRRMIFLISSTRVSEYLIDDDVLLNLLIKNLYCFVCYI